MKHLLISLLIISVSNSHGAVLKCCLNNAIIIKNQTTYKCSDISLHTFKQEFIPLKIKGDYKFGIPINCNDSETCVDKNNKNKIIELSCDTLKAETNKAYPILYKCCPNKMFYNIRTKSCEQNVFSLESFIHDSSSPIYNLKYGTPVCNGSYIDYLHHTPGDFNIKFGSLMISHDMIPESIGEKEFCIDKTTEKAVIRYCLPDYSNWCAQPNVTCIRKCCPFGHHYEKINGIPNCVAAWNQTIDYIFADADNGSVDALEKVSIMRKQTCYDGFYIANPKPVMFLNGTILLSGSKNISLDSHLHRYCVEHFHEHHFQDGGTQYLICFLPQDTTANSMNFFVFIGLMISVLFLAATLTVYFFLPELQNLHGKTVMCHTACLLVAYICLSAVKKSITRYHSNICLTIAYCITYSFFAVFCWLNVMCFDIWWTFGTVKARGLAKNGDKKKFMYYCLYAFGIPVVFCSIIAIADCVSWIPENYKPKIGQVACWFDYRLEIILTIYFIGPIGIQIFCNLVLFILTVKNCMKIRADIHKMQDYDSRKKNRFLADKATLVMNLKLFILMGITWSFEVFSTYLKSPQILWTILDVLNILQGFSIFVIFVLKEKVWKALQHKMGYHGTKETSTRTTSVSGKMSNASMVSMKIVENKTEPLRVNVVRKQSNKRDSNSD